MCNIRRGRRNIRFSRAHEKEERREREKDRGAAAVNICPGGITLDLYTHRFFHVDVTLPRRFSLLVLLLSRRRARFYFMFHRKETTSALSVIYPHCV